MNKYSIAIGIGILAFLAAGILISKRRDLPFQEVIALDKGIAVVNGQHWYQNKLQVLCKSDGRLISRKTFGNNGFVIFTNLENNHVYSIEIFRTDIKGKLLYKPLKKIVTPHRGGDKYYILVGASISKNWKFDKLPNRLHLGKNIIFGKRIVYQFDKLKTVKEIINLPFPVTAVILKECSAYFPRNLKESERQFVSWGKMLEQKGIKPIFATTVPVTEDRAHETPGKQKSLEGFNDFIRQYGRQANIPVLDLEEALRKSATDRHLRNDFAVKDGVHLVDKAYLEKLNLIVLPVLKLDTKNNQPGK